MDKPGPKSALLDKEVLAKIKQAVFDFTTLKDIAKACEIPESTMYHWHSDNYENIRDKIEGWRRDKKLEKADAKLDEILELDPTEKEFTPSVLKAAIFVKETLDKQNYSKRSELTGKDGKDLPTPIMMVERETKE